MPWCRVAIVNQVIGLISYTLELGKNALALASPSGV